VMSFFLHRALFGERGNSEVQADRSADRQHGSRDTTGERRGSGSQAEGQARVMISAPPPIAPAPSALSPLAIRPVSSGITT